MRNILSAVTSAHLLGASATQIDAIRTAAGLTEAQFNGLCLPVLHAYASRVQNLPFSPTVFARPQGAWDCGLVCATVAYQYAGTVIFFPDMGAEERRLIERQCRYMCFVATLAACLSLTTGATRIVDGETEYHPLLSNHLLRDWLIEHPAATFSWRTNTAQLNSQVCAAITSRFVPVGLMQNFDLRAALMIYDPIALSSKLVGVESTLARVVRQSVQKVLEHYTEQEARVYKDGGTVAPAAQIDVATVTSQMAASANRTLPSNPLATAPVASPEVVNASVLTPASQPVPSTGYPPASAAVGEENRSVPTSTPAAPSTVRPPAPEAIPASDQLRGKDQVLVEWFAALKLHARYPDLAKHLSETDEGVLVPINMLGLFGVSGPTIRKKMEQAGFVVRRSDDARSVILIPSLRSQFFAGEAPAAE